MDTDEQAPSGPHEPPAPGQAGRLAVPAAIFTRLHPPSFTLYDEDGAPLAATGGEAEARPAPTVFVDSADAAGFRAYLRQSLRAILEDPGIASVDRGWAAHRALLHEVAAVYGGRADRARAGSMVAVMREVVRLIHRHGFPDDLFSGVRGATRYSLVVHAMETAIGAVSLAIADGQRGPEFLVMLGVGAACADVGLLGVPEAIREKTAPTPAEAALLRRHPEASVERMRALGIVGDVAHNAVAFHHEHWDGSGYPGGRSGERIPVEARYVAVADAYATLTVPTRDRPRLARAEAIEEIASSGQFDQRIVRRLVELLLPARHPLPPRESADAPAA